MDARQRLREWVERSKLTYREAAKLLGMHYTFLSQILNDDRDPALRTAVRIERVTGIPAVAWVTTDVESPDAAMTERPRKVQHGKL